MNIKKGKYYNIPNEIGIIIGLAIILISIFKIKWSLYMIITAFIFMLYLVIYLILQGRINKG